MQAALALCPLLTYSDTTNEKLFGKINLPAVCSDRRTNDRCDDVENELQGYTRLRGRGDGGRKQTQSGITLLTGEENSFAGVSIGDGLHLQNAAQHSAAERCVIARIAVAVCLAGVDPPGLMSQYLCKFQQVLFFLSKESSVECV